MIVAVHLHTIYQLQTPDGLVKLLEMDLPPGSTLRALVERLDVPIDPDNTLLVVNGRTVKFEDMLADGDQVHLIPAISGG